MLEETFKIIADLYNFCRWSITVFRVQDVHAHHTALVTQCRCPFQSSTANLCYTLLTAGHLGFNSSEGYAKPVPRYVK